MEFKEYLAIIRRRWLLFFPIFVLIVGAHLFWVTRSNTSTFVATSRVILARDSVGPNAKSVSPIDGLSLVTKEAMLTHRPVLEQAALIATGGAEFESKEFQGGDFPSAIETGRQQIASTFGSDETAMEAVVDHMNEHLVVETNHDRQIADLSMAATTPEMAKLLSWAIAEGACQFHRQKSRASTEEYLESLTHKIAEAESQVEEARATLNTVKASSAIDDLAAKEEQIQTAIYRIRDKDIQIEAAARMNDRKIQERLATSSWERRSDVNAASLLTSRRLEQIRDDLFEMKLDYETKVVTFAPGHPDLKSLVSQMRGLEKALEEEQASLIKQRYQKFSEQTRDVISESASLQLQRDVFSEHLNKLTAELRDLQQLRQQFAPREAELEEALARLDGLRGIEKEVRWEADSRTGSVLVYDPAADAEPVLLRGGGFGPLTLTMLMALIFSLGVVYIVEYLDTRVKNEHDIRRHLNLPLLGTIPKEGDDGRLLLDAPPQSEISEKFNTAATLLQSIANDLDIRAIMVCSAIAREGKTTVSVNLAVSLARKGHKVVLIDGDLRISQVHHLLRVSNHTGLSTALDPHVSAQQILEGVLTEDAIEGRQTSALSVCQPTSVANLDVVAAGPQTTDPVVLLDPIRLSKFVQELKKTYDFVVFDTPPINKVGDALTISSCVDGSVFVVGAGQAEQHEVTWAKHLLTNVQSNILGVFLNKFQKQKGGEYYYYYYHNDQKQKRVKSRV